MRGTDVGGDLIDKLVCMGCELFLVVRDQQCTGVGLDGSLYA